MTLIVFYALLHLQMAPALDLCHVELQPQGVSQGGRLGAEGQGRMAGRQGDLHRARKVVEGRQVWAR
jgi:hypothetical protein